MRIVFFGTPSFAVPSLQILLQRSEFEVVAVVSQPDRPQGRGRKLLPTPVKALAQEHQIPVWQPNRLRKDEEVLTALDSTQADVFVVVAYGQILSPQVLSMPRLGCVNVHGSLLPAYRGAAPIQWAIARGETETGITTMLMDEGMDTGAMLLKAALPITPEQTSADLAALLAPLGAELLVDTLLQLDAGSITPTPQDPELATYAPLIKPADFHLHWEKSAWDLHNQIRAFYPQCYSGWQGERLKILRSDPPTADPSQLSGAEMGMITAIQKGEGFSVQTGTNSLGIREVQMAGKRVQSAWDFANGVRLEVGQKLEPLIAEGED
jgi:methionyl-tRNA formyltransferase